MNHSVKHALETSMHKSKMDATESMSLTLARVSIRWIWDGTSPSLQELGRGPHLCL